MELESFSSIISNVINRAVEWDECIEIVGCSFDEISSLQLQGYELRKSLRNTLSVNCRSKVSEQTAKVYQLIFDYATNVIHIRELMLRLNDLEAMNPQLSDIIKKSAQLRSNINELARKYELTDSPSILIE